MIIFHKSVSTIMLHKESTTISMIDTEKENFVNLVEKVINARIAMNITFSMHHCMYFMQKHKMKMKKLN